MDVIIFSIFTAFTLIFILFGVYLRKNFGLLIAFLGLCMSFVFAGLLGADKGVITVTSSTSFLNGTKAVTVTTTTPLISQSTNFLFVPLLFVVFCVVIMLYKAFA